MLVDYMLGTLEMRQTHVACNMLPHVSGSDSKRFHLQQLSTS